MKVVDFIDKMATTGGVALVGSGIEGIKASLIIEALSKNHNLIIVGYKGEENLKNTSFEVSQDKKNLKSLIEDFMPEEHHIRPVYHRKKYKEKKDKNWWKVIGKNLKKK